MAVTREGGDIQITVLAVVDVQLDGIVNRLVGPTLLLVIGFKELHRRGECMLSIYLPERLECDFGISFVFPTQLGISVFTTRSFFLYLQNIFPPRPLCFAFVFKTLAIFFPSGK